jgi:hypothetical protein
MVTSSPAWPKPARPPCRRRRPKRVNNARVTGVGGSRKDALQLYLIDWAAKGAVAVAMTRRTRSKISRERTPSSWKDCSAGSSPGMVLHDLVLDWRPGHRGVPAVEILRRGPRLSLHPLSMPAGYRGLVGPSRSAGTARHPRMSTEPYVSGPSSSWTSPRPATGKTGFDSGDSQLNAG